ncbi:MAG: SCO family protein [Roseovarius sp.]|nr:SCO family protein [Roseovarius sp.]
MTIKTTARRARSMCAVALTFAAFAVSGAASADQTSDGTGQAQGHNHAVVPESHDHSVSHGASQEVESHDHSMGHDHNAAEHRMPDHLGMDAENTAEAAMRPDGFQYKRSLNDYPAPDITLRNQFGQKVNFAELMDFDGPVLLNFIFTSCATICPVMSATFGQTQESLAAIDDHYLMVSISIDPEYDTPARLRDYAQLHGARDNWVMLTGQFDDIFTVVRAFDAIYKGENKMYHRPLTFLRKAKDAPWLRLEGLLGSEELAEEYAALVRPEVN